MKKKLFLSGSVFEFYISPIQKFAYCKILDFTNIQSFGGLVGQVFNKFSDLPNDDLMTILDSDWLFGPRSLHKWPTPLKQSGFRYMGVVASRQNETVPDFKGCNAFPYVVDDESSIKPWYPIINFVGGDFCDYEKVQHLEQMIITPMLGISIRSGMEYCRINHLDVAKFYDVNKASNLSVYRQMINTPVYSSIPSSIRDKAQI